MRAALALLSLLAFAPAANAQLRALSTAGTPVLAGDRVLWLRHAGSVFEVLGAPLAGGPGARIGAVPIAQHAGAGRASGDGVRVTVVAGADGAVVARGPWAARSATSVSTVATSRS